MPRKQPCDAAQPLVAQLGQYVGLATCKGPQELVFWEDVHNLGDGENRLETFLNLSTEEQNNLRIDQISHVFFTLDLGSTPSEIKCRLKRAVVCYY